MATTTKCTARPLSVWPMCECARCATVRKERRRAWEAGTLDEPTAEQAWARLDELTALGYSPKWIGTAAGLDEELIGNALSERRVTGHGRRFGVGACRAIVAADMRDATAGTVPALGTRRRLQALAVEGWRLLDIESATGLSIQTLAPTQRGDSDSVTPATYNGVRDFYDEHSESTGPSRKGATRARNRGWLPAVWDDPDTDAGPPALVSDIRIVDEVAVRRLVHDGDMSLARVLRKWERVEAVRQWQATGRSLHSLEVATGWNVARYLDRQEAS